MNLCLCIKDIARDSDSAREINVGDEKAEQTEFFEMQFLFLLCFFKVI